MLTMLTEFKKNRKNRAEAYADVETGVESRKERESSAHESDRL